MNPPRPFVPIREACEIVGEPQHILRFWERNIAELRPAKRAGGRRYYRESDIRLLHGIRILIRRDGFTLRGVQRYLHQHGAKAVMRLHRSETTAEAAGRKEALLEAAAALRECAQILRSAGGPPNAPGGSDAG